MAAQQAAQAMNKGCRGSRKRQTPVKMFQPIRARDPKRAMALSVCCTERPGLEQHYRAKNIHPRLSRGRCTSGRFPLFVIASNLQGRAERALSGPFLAPPGARC